MEKGTMRRNTCAVLVGVLMFGVGRTTLAQSREEGFVTAPDSVRLFYEKVGAGPRVVIVPGRLFISDQLGLLGDPFTVIAYDMRGRGRSDVVRDSTRISIQQDVEDLETIRRHFQAPRISVVGYSYLGLMVMMYAARHGEAVDRIVQLGPVPMQWDTQFPAELRAPPGPTGADSADIKRLAELEAAGIATSNPREHCEARWRVSRFGLVGNPANVARLGGSQCSMPNEWPANFQRQLRHHFGSVQALRPAWTDFAMVRQPVLTIHGTHDRNAAYGAGREWANRLPNGRLITVRGAAHQLFSEYPDIVFPAMREFLLGAWPVSAEVVGGAR
jgi:pimeloyl-ACP methyl ester carboxylesterase